VVRGLSTLAFALLAAAAPAFAAQVTDVRVGQHPGFSRVVFELDSATGYKVERQVGAGGTSELIVSLAASAKPEVLRGRLDYIESVEVKPVGTRSATVRIRLKRGELKLKEMILAGPPRIVLDVLGSAPVAKKPAPTAAKKTAAKTPGRTPAKTAAKPLEKKAAETKVAATPVAKPPAKTVAPSPTTAAGPEPKPARVVPAPAPATVRKVTAPPAALPDAEAGKTAAARVVAKGPDAGPAVAPVPVPAKTPMPTPAPAAALPEPGVAPAPPAPDAMPMMPARPAPTPAETVRSPVQPPRSVAPAAEGPFTLQNIAVGVVGLLMVLAAAVFFIRRRSAVEVVDASAFESPLDEAENPFAGLDASLVAPDADGSDPDEMQAITEEIPIRETAKTEPELPIFGTPAQSSDILDELRPTEKAASNKGNAMDMASDNSHTTVRNMGAAPGSSEVTRMIAEFERRMAAMETRIDELVDAKERLERQVAAQTEELRVQRAAIARTQRAVRNLSRPGEDAPTEPALRDPSRPEGPRS
jgi:hypothetical protein